MRYFLQGSFLALCLPTKKSLGWHILGLNSEPTIIIQHRTVFLSLVQ